MPLGERGVTTTTSSRPSLLKSPASKRDDGMSTASAEAQIPAALSWVPLDVSTLKSAPVGLVARRGVTTIRSSRLSLLTSPPRKRAVVTSTASEDAHVPAELRRLPFEVRAV